MSARTVDNRKPPTHSMREMSYLEESVYLNYANLMGAIIARTNGKLSKHIHLLNCAVDCEDYANRETRYISPNSYHFHSNHLTNRPKRDIIR